MGEWLCLFLADVLRGGFDLLGAANRERVHGCQRMFCIDSLCEENYNNATAGQVDSQVRRLHCR